MRRLALLALCLLPACAPAGAPASGGTTGSTTTLKPTAPAGPGNATQEAAEAPAAPQSGAALATRLVVDGKPVQLLAAPSQQKAPFGFPLPETLRALVIGKYHPAGETTGLTPGEGQLNITLTSRQGFNQAGWVISDVTQGDFQLGVVNEAKTLSSWNATTIPYPPPSGTTFSIARAGDRLDVHVVAVMKKSSYTDADVPIDASASFTIAPNK